MAIDWSKYQPTTTNAPTSNRVDWSKYGGGVQEAQPEKKTDFFGGVSTFLKGLTMLPKSIAASVLQATQGKKGASVVERDWADNFISSVGSDMDRFVQETRGKYGEAKLLPGMPFKITDIASLPQNMAFSITSMGAGLGAGVPTALVPLPGMRVAAWAAGTAASGAAAYSSTTYQIMQQYLEGKDSEKRAKTGKGLTKEEEVALKDDFDKKAHEYGLWEAVPEAISNLGFGKLLQPLTKVAGKAIAGRVVTFLAGTYGTELLTETVTQKGQSAIEAEAGLRAGKLTWTEAFKEIFPQTFLLTTIMAGAGATGATAMRNYQAKVNASLEEEAKKKKIPLNSELYQETKKQVNQGFEEVQKKEVTKPQYEEWLKTNPEANKIITDVTEKAKTIPNVKDKIAFLKQEKQKFDAKFSNEYAKTIKEETKPAEIVVTETKFLETPAVDVKSDKGRAIFTIDNNEGFIQRIVVGDKFQNKGEGTKLVQRIIEEAKARGLTKLTVETASPSSVGLFKKNNFKVSGTNNLGKPRFMTFDIKAQPTKTTPVSTPTTPEAIKIKDLETLKERLTDENGKLDPVFEGSTIERQYELANKLVAEVGEKTAIDIANKIIPLPKGYEELRPAALARLLAESENLTFEGYNRLMDNPNETPYSVSEAGSALSLSRAKGEFNPVDVARDVEKTRAKQAKKTGEKAVPSKSDLKNIIKRNLKC
jgi:GNAT superfamily N-acetyltransferase